MVINSEFSSVPKEYRHIFPHKQRVALDLQFKVPRDPKDFGLDGPTKRPDLTNCQKAIEDCISGTFFDDDKRVCDIHSSKHWSDHPDMAGVWVQIDLIKPRSRDYEPPKKNSGPQKQPLRTLENGLKYSWVSKKTLSYRSVE
jgi:Holliday junction resolvase RusA-like endonuclease